MDANALVVAAIERHREATEVCVALDKQRKAKRSPSDEREYHRTVLDADDALESAERVLHQMLWKHHEGRFSYNGEIYFASAKNKPKADWSVNVLPDFEAK